MVKLILQTVLMLACLVAAISTADAQQGLRTPVPALCFTCHDKVKAETGDRHVHVPLKQGQCDACHNSHVSSVKGLLSQPANDLCLKCHRSIAETLRKPNTHGALQGGGACSGCHRAHSSAYPALLTEKETELCWKCHQSLKDTVSSRPVVHAPLKDGKCSSCHDAHGSDQRNQLKSAPDKLCSSCHQPRCSVGGSSVAFLTKGMRCTQCHSGHVSDKKGLLGPFAHSFFLAKECSQCHKAVVPGKAYPTKAAGQALCMTCHKEGVLKFRPNDIHGSTLKNPCDMCHQHHAADRKAMLQAESEVCSSCHDIIFKKTRRIERSFAPLKCAPLRNRACFECHTPLHSSNEYYFRFEAIETCTRCHTEGHKTSHPLGGEVRDPRTGKTITCITCHSMHSPKADHLLQYDRKRQLCVQCHRGM